MRRPVQCPKCQEFEPLVHRLASSVWSGVQQWACDVCGHGWVIRLRALDDGERDYESGPAESH